VSDPVLIDGQPAQQIPVIDRGLQYGDGLFETLAVIDTIPRQWDRHMARLSRGEAALGFPESDKELLRREAESLCGGCSRGVLKIIVTRGSGGRGYRPPAHPQPRRILSLHPWPDYPDAWYRDGITLRVCETRWSRNRQLAGVKHLNRLEQVLARQEWSDPGIVEGLMLNELDQVISATQGNLFLLTEGVVLTPDLTHSGIAGVTREIVLDVTQAMGMPVRIENLSLDQVERADAVFVTNSLLGLCPVSRLGLRWYDVRSIPSTLRNRVAESLLQLR